MNLTVLGTRSRPKPGFDLGDKQTTNKGADTEPWPAKSSNHYGQNDDSNEALFVANQVSAQLNLDNLRDARLTAKGAVQEIQALNKNNATEKDVSNILNMLDVGGEKLCFCFELLGDPMTMELDEALLKLAQNTLLKMPWMNDSYFVRCKTRFFAHKVNGFVGRMFGEAHTRLREKMADKIEADLQTGFIPIINDCFRFGFCNLPDGASFSSSVTMPLKDPGGSMRFTAVTPLDRAPDDSRRHPSPLSSLYAWDIDTRFPLIVEGVQLPLRLPRGQDGQLTQLQGAMLEALRAGGASRCPDAGVVEYQAALKRAIVTGSVAEAVFLLDHVSMPAKWLEDAFFNAVNPGRPNGLFVNPRPWIQIFRIRDDHKVDKPVVNEQHFLALLEHAKALSEEALTALFRMLAFNACWRLEEGGEELRSHLLETINRKRHEAGQGRAGASLRAGEKWSESVFGYDTIDFIEVLWEEVKVIFTIAIIAFGPRG